MDEASLWLELRQRRLIVEAIGRAMIRIAQNQGRTSATYLRYRSAWSE